MNLMERLISIDMLYHYLAILAVGHFIMNRSKEQTQSAVNAPSTLCQQSADSAQSGSSGNYGCTDLLADRQQGSSVH